VKVPSSELASAGDETWLRRRDRGRKDARDHVIMSACVVRTRLLLPENVSGGRHAAALAFTDSGILNVPRLGDKQIL
jgi:hypothetical protein